MKYCNGTGITLRLTVMVLVLVLVSKYFKQRYPVLITNNPKGTIHLLSKTACFRFRGAANLHLKHLPSNNPFAQQRSEPNEASRATWSAKKQRCRNPFSGWLIWSNISRRLERDLKMHLHRRSYFLIHPLLIFPPLKSFYGLWATTSWQVSVISMSSLNKTTKTETFYFIYMYVDSFNYLSPSLKIKSPMNVQCSGFTAHTGIFSG